MNQRTQIPSISELESRVAELRAQLPAHLQRINPASRLRKSFSPNTLSRSTLGIEFKSQLMILEGLKVEALLLLEQAGLKPHVRDAKDMDLSSDLSNQITEDLPPERSPSLSQNPSSVSSEGDLLEELANYVSPLELMEQELAQVAAQETSSTANQRDPLEEALSTKTTERATVVPAAILPVRAVSLSTRDELQAEQAQRLMPPTLKVEQIKPEPIVEIVDLELPSEKLQEVARQIRAQADPSDPVPATPRKSTISPQARSSTMGLWKRSKIELKALLLPLTRSPDAELAIYGGGPRIAPVDTTPPWLSVVEVDWQNLDWRVIQEQLGPYASISMAPRSFAPRSQLPKRPVELRLEERVYLEGEYTIPSAPPVSMATDDSLDLEDAFAEYDEPVSDEALRLDPELAEMADAYSALEMSLQSSSRQVVDEFSDRDGLFEDSLAPHVSAHLEAEYGDDLDETGSLDELLQVNPLDEDEEMEFDFGEDSPLVWTEASPTPLFSDEPTPSPMYQRGARRQQKVDQASAQPTEEPKIEQRTGVFGRLFNKN